MVSVARAVILGVSMWLTWETCTLYLSTVPTGSYCLALTVGAVSTALWGKVLKHLVNEKRPEGTSKADPGFPSSHASVLGYFASAFVKDREELFVLLPPAAVLLLALNMRHRVQQGYHTWGQVVAGCAFGASCEHLWRSQVMRGLKPGPVTLYVSLAALVLVWLVYKKLLLPRLLRATSKNP